LSSVQLKDVGDIERPIESLARMPGGGLLIVPDAMIVATAIALARSLQRYCRLILPGTRNAIRAAQTEAWAELRNSAVARHE
jgi:hypothetical protein